MSRAKSREQTHARSGSSRDSVFRRQRMTYESPSPTGNASPGKVFAIAAMGVFLAALDLFIVNIAFPAIQRDFSGSSVSDVSWMLNVYAIVFAALLVSAGKLGDILGRRRVFVAGLLAFGLGSAPFAAAPSLELLIAARVIQGAGAAAVTPTPTSLGLLLPAFGTPSGAAAATDTCSRVSPRICSTNLPALDPRGRQDAA